MTFNQENQLVSDIASLRHNQDFNDVIINLRGNRSVRANKVILSARSKYLKNLIDQEKSNFIDGGNIQVEVDTTEEAMTTVLEFFYTGKAMFGNFGLSDLLVLLQLLDLLKLQDLFDCVKDHVMKTQSHIATQAQCLKILFEFSDFFKVETE